MPLQITAPATIKALNIRKEGPDDNKQVAIDISFEVEQTPAENILILFGTEHFDDIYHFWIADKAAAFKLPGISQIVSNAVFQNGYQLELLRNISYVDKIGKFKLKPRDGRQFDLEFKVSIKAPTDALLKALAHNIHDTIKIKIIPPNELNFTPAKPT